MSPARRFMFAGLAVAAVEAALGFVALSTGLAPYFFACAGATVVLGIAGRRLMVRGRDEPGDDPGGGPPKDPDEPPPPPWWPDFERRFWAHVRDRARPQPPVH